MYAVAEPGKITSDEGLTGKMYKGKIACAWALVDERGSLKDAIQLAGNSNFSIFNQIKWAK